MGCGACSLKLVKLEIDQISIEAKSFKVTPSFNSKPSPEQSKIMREFVKSLNFGKGERTKCSATRPCLNIDYLHPHYKSKNLQFQRNMIDLERAESEKLREFKNSLYKISKESINSAA